MGVHRTVVVETSDPDELRDTTGPHDVVIDTTPRSASAAGQAVAAAQPGGRVVLCGLKGPGVRFDLDVDAIVLGRLTVIGPASKTMKSFKRAIDALNSGRLPLDLMTTAAYPLDRALEAIESITSSDPDRPFHVRVDAQGR
jgi:threonine dehydrogenase-like Zn-dependent dehydrogenase